MPMWPCVPNNRKSFCLELLSVILIYIMAKVSGEKDCRSVSSIKEYTLTGHVYRTFGNKQLTTCLVTCDNDPSCYSINYKFTTRQCELCDTTRVSHPGEFVYTPDSVYLEHLFRPAGSCSGQLPCKNRGTCVNIPQVPGYRCFCRDSYVGEFCQECTSPPLGLSNGDLANDKITGSSVGQWVLTYYHPYKARLNGPSSWVASYLDTNPFLEINLAPRLRLITTIATQGDTYHDWWTKKYTVMYSANRKTWQYYGIGGKTKVFQGNWNKYMVVKHSFTPPFQARYVKILPREKNTRTAIRVELYGCYAE